MKKFTKTIKGKTYHHSSLGSPIMIISEGSSKKESLGNIIQNLIFSNIKLGNEIVSLSTSDFRMRGTKKVKSLKLEDIEKYLKDIKIKVSVELK